MGSLDRCDPMAARVGLARNSGRNTLLDPHLRDQGEVAVQFVNPISILRKCHCQLLRLSFGVAGLGSGEPGFGPLGIGLSLKRPPLPDNKKIKQ